jgi:arylsulfatase A-like enzyme
MLNRGGQAALTAGHKQNGELLGFKFDAWEGGHRVPMIVRWPEKIKPGSKTDQLISNIDIIHSLASLTGYQLKEGDAPDSYNMLPVLLGSTDAELRDHLVLAPLKESHMALRKGDWIYIGSQGGGGFSARNPGDHGLGGPPALKFAGQVNSDIEDGKIKPDAPREQLYNLDKDLHQGRNIIREEPVLAEEMKEMLRQLKMKPSSREE